MIRGLIRRPPPVWLSEAHSSSPFPLHDLLKGSLFYPSSGRDGDPVRYLGGYIHSFVYADFGIERRDLLASLTDEHHAFRGYSLAFSRDLEMDDLVPQGWVADMPTEADGDWRRSALFRKRPFAHWCVLSRCADRDDDYGPERFSLLYVGGDGTASFQGLYGANACSPEIVAVVQPGTGFGGNWTDFRDPNQIFARAVLENATGAPRYLLYGGRGELADYDKPCWPSYEHLVNKWKVADGCLTLWKR